MKAPYSISGLRETLGRFSRIPLIHVPTPFRKLEGLTEMLGGPPIHVKRDDLTGLAFGGNKSRKLEYILAAAKASGADTIVTWGGLQSNWCMQTSAAARMLGLEPVLVLFGPGSDEGVRDGNLLLDSVLQADIRRVERGKGKVVKPAEALAVLKPIAEDLRKQGRRPYIVPVGGSQPAGDMTAPLGAVGYVAAFAEMLDQANDAGVEVKTIVHATGSGGTQAGLVVGARALAPDCRVVGISVSDPRESFSREVLDIAVRTDEVLRLGLGITPADIVVEDGYIGEGYGILHAEAARAIRTSFVRDGIVLDPVYTGKAMAGLIDLVSTGKVSPGEPIVFFHTGGTPALFPYRRELLAFLEE